MTPQEKPLNEGLELWFKVFSEIPIDDNDRILESFEDFEIGTSRFDIFHWFEESFKDFIVGEVINGYYDDETKGYESK